MCIHLLRCVAVAAAQATADLERGKAMYDHYTQVPDSLLPVRDLVILNRKARGMFVQVSRRRMRDLTMRLWLKLRFDRSSLG